MIAPAIAPTTITHNHRIRRAITLVAALERLCSVVSVPKKGRREIITISIADDELISQLSAYQLEIRVFLVTGAAASLTFFHSAATCLHVPARLTRESTKHEGLQPRASERHVVGCCEELDSALTTALLL